MTENRLYASYALMHAASGPLVRSTYHADRQAHEPGARYHIGCGTFSPGTTA